jgi:1-deoxy-D-xylulose-5-phosphate synthase
VVITVEDHSLTGGFGSAVLEEAHKAAAGTDRNVRIVVMGGPDSYIRHASRDQQLREAGLDALSIAQVVRRAVASFCLRD